MLRAAAGDWRGRGAGVARSVVLRRSACSCPCCRKHFRQHPKWLLAGDVKRGPPPSPARSCAARSAIQGPSIGGASRLPLAWRRKVFRRQGREHATRRKTVLRTFPRTPRPQVLARLKEENPAGSRVFLVERKSQLTSVCDGARAARHRRRAATPRSAPESAPKASHCHYRTPSMCRQQ